MAMDLLRATSTMLISHTTAHILGESFSCSRIPESLGPSGSPYSYKIVYADMNDFSVLYGRSTTTASVSQSINNLIAGQSYLLQYFYNVEQASPQAICMLTVTLGGQVVDAITSPTVRSGRYLMRSVSVTPSSASETLAYTLTCPRFLQLTAQSNYALDAITLTTGCS